MLVASLTAMPGAGGRWHAGIGDPSPMGWVTVVACFAAAALALGAYRIVRSEVRALELFWALLALVMLALGINKQLDLQSWGTEIMRDLAHRQGWYEERREVQALFVVTITILGAVGLVVMAAAMRRHLRAVWVPILGIAELVVFVLARASSIHKMDRLIGTVIVDANDVIRGA